VSVRRPIHLSLERGDLRFPRALQLRAGETPPEVGDVLCFEFGHPLSPARVRVAGVQERTVWVEVLTDDVELDGVAVHEWRMLGSGEVGRVAGA
jgi:hypothetical protein